jgi:TrmH family RNA methyltransferase
MPVGAVILVETSLPGNLGSAIRVAANFGVRTVELVRPAVDPNDPEVRSWACGGHELVTVRVHDSLDHASALYRTLIGSASGRGRDNQPVVTPREAFDELRARGGETTALVFGNETSGLRRDDIDRCDLIVRIPTAEQFPVLNLAQSIAILVAHLSMQLEPPPPTAPEPAAQEEIAGLMLHLKDTLVTVGFLDPVSPDRILRKLRRLFGRAGITSNEVAILRGVCRQVDWAVGRKAARNRKRET